MFLCKKKIFFAIFLHKESHEVQVKRLIYYQIKPFSYHLNVKINISFDEAISNLLRSTGNTLPVLDTSSCIFFDDWEVTLQ